MKVLKGIIFGICVLVFASGCSRKIDKEKDIVNHAEEISLVVQEKISSNLSVNIDRTFESQILKKYWIKPESYPVNQNWAQSIADQFYKSESARVEEVEDYEEKYGVRLFFIDEDKGDLSVSGNDIFISIDRDFYDNCEAYYHDGGIYPFFHEQMDIYYNQADLPFMSYSEAEELSKSLLEAVGFSYNENTSKGYALSEDAIMKYKDDHKERFIALEQSLEEMKQANTGGKIGSFISDWKGTGGFYVFYYPIKIGDLLIDEESISTVMYAYVVVNSDGIARAQIPSQYQIEKSEDVSIVKPETALNKLIEMYENTILTGNVTISDVDLVFAQTAFENSYKSELDIRYVISPVWKFKVFIQEGEEIIEGSVLYDAVTGERTG